jgi:hypothetical protein
MQSIGDDSPASGLCCDVSGPDLEVTPSAESLNVAESAESLTELLLFAFRL